jgi:hypothetical protein
MQMQISVNENEYMINYYKNNEMNLFVIMMMMLFVDYLLEFLMHELDFLLNIQNMHGNKLNLLMTIDK